MIIFAVSFNELDHSWHIKSIPVEEHGDLLRFAESVDDRSYISVDNLGKITDSKVFCDKFGIRKAKKTLLESIEDKIDDIKDELGYLENLKFDMEVALTLEGGADASI